MDTQQEHIYNGRIQEFFPLFDKIKKENDLIYNARVDFNTVKFLIERADWDWSEDKDKNKACDVILQECDKTKKAKQELEDKAKEELNKYITNANNINDDVKDEKVSIYGNHASIELKGNKKEFKISEFLNSDFCQKNGISGFSTSHGDGKSGMHGFVAEKGGKKVRHYVVTDGSYEMTLNWYDKNGEKCTIKIKIDKDGVDLTERNGVTAGQLEANKDVKIGGLFLHQIQFREKGQANEVEHDGQGNQALNKSFETFIESDVSRGVGVQTTQVGSQTPPLPPLRTSSLKKDVFDEQNGLDHQDGGQKGKHQPTTVSSGNDYGFPSSNPSDFTKSVSHNQDNRQKDERYDNPTFTTFRSEKKGDRQSHSGPQSNSKKLSYKSEDAKESGNTGDKQLLQDVASILARRAEIEFLSGIEEDFNNEINSQEAKEKRERRQAAREENSGDQVYNLKSLFEENSQNKKTPPPLPPSSLPLKNDVFDEQGNGSQKPNDLHRDEQTLDNQQQSKTQQQEGKSKQEPKGGKLNYKKGESSSEPEANGKSELSSNTADVAQKRFSENVLEKIKEEKPIYKWLKDKIEDKEENQNLNTMEKKLSQTSSISKDPFSENVLEKIKEDKPIYKWLKDKIEDKEENQNLDTMEKKLSQTSSISKDPFSENVLKKIKEDKPIYKWLKDKIEGKEGNQNLDTMEEKLSQTSDQSDVVEKRENDSQRPLSPIGTDGNVDVGQNKDTQLQESSRRSGQESVEEERNFQKISEALESWKEKRRNAKQSNSNPSSKIHANHNESQVNPEHLNSKLEENELNHQKENKAPEEHGKNSKDHNSETHNNYRRINEDVKETSFNTPEKIQSELQKDDLADVKTVAEQKNADTNLTIDKNSKLYKLLEKDAAQLKVGGIEEEDNLTEYTDSYDRNRVALGNRNKRPLNWAKQVAESQQKKDKGISI